MAERADLAVETKVRNLKTRLVGKVKDFKDQETAIVTYEHGDFTSRVSDLEILNEGEFELVKKYVEAKKNKTQLAAQLEEAKSAEAKLEEKIVDYLLKHDTESTKCYEGLGRVMMDGRKIYASISEDNKEAAFKAIQEMGRGEIIKPTIHPATLNSFITELVDTGKEVPKVINYFNKPKLSVKKT